MSNFPDNYTTTAYNAGPGRAMTSAVVKLAFAAHIDNERVRAAIQAALDVIARIDADNHCMAPGYGWSDIVAGLLDMMPRTDCAERVSLLDEWAADRVGECVG
jgi:hypothetical protein